MVGGAITRRLAHRVALAAARPLVRRGAHEDDRVQIRFLLMHAWGMGGTIRSTLELAGQLAQHHDVEVISVVRRREQPHFPFASGLSVTAIDDQRPGRAGGLAPVLRRSRGLLMNPLDRAARSSTLWTDVMVVRRLRRMGAGVLIGTRPSLNLLALDLAAPGVATIGVEHMHLARHSDAMRAEIARRYPALDALVTLTPSDRAAYREHLQGATRVVAIPNAVPATSAPPADPASTVVLAVGRLTHQKGFERLVRAFAPLAAAHPGWTLRICGNGPKRAPLRRLVGRLGLTGRVQLPGAVQGVDDEMSQASVFALSSRFEGFPMVLLEAMAAGLAIVSFDCPTGPRELLDDERTGILVPEGDVKALTAALERVVSDPELRSRLGSAAREAARAYAPERVSARWEELLRGLGDRVSPAAAPGAAAARGPWAGAARAAPAAPAPPGAPVLRA
jgi:glycosyltransferase involved in cell wall biosynthesis